MRKNVPNFFFTFSLCFVTVIYTPTRIHCYSRYIVLDTKMWSLSLKLPLLHLSHLVGKPTMWFPTRSDTNRAVQTQKTARSMKFRIYEVEGLYYPCNENKGADQLRGSEADMRLCFRLCRLLVFP